MWSVWLVFCDCCFHSVCPLVEKGKRLIEVSWWERLSGKLGLVLMGRAILSKSLIQFSVDGWSSFPSLLFDLRSNYGGGNHHNGNLLPKVPCTHCHTQGSQLCRGPQLIHTSSRDSWTLTGKSGSVSCGVAAPFSWVLVHTRFCLSPKIWLGVYFVKVHTKTSTTRLCFLGLYTLYAPRFNTTSLSYFLVSHISLPFGILFHAFW